MATLTNRISLEGGDEIRRQLDAVAETAEQLFRGLRQLSEQFGSIDAGGLQRARSELQQTAQVASQTSSQVQSVGGGLLSFATKTAVGIGAMVVAASGVLSALATSAATSAAALSNTASGLGLSIEAYQRLKAGADAAGLSVESLSRFFGNVDQAATQAAGALERVLPTDTVGRFQMVGGTLQQIAGGLAVAQQQADAFGRTAGGSIDLIQKFGDTTIRVINGVSQSTFDLASSSERLKQGASGAAQALTQLGISTQVFSTLSRDAQLRLLAEQLAKLPEGAAKAALAAQLFGAEWRAALNLFSQMPAVLDRANDSVRRLGEGEIKAGKALSDALAELGSASDALKNRIGNLVAPSRTLKAEWLTSLIDGANRLLQQFIAADGAKKKLLDSGNFDLFRDLDFDKFQDFLNQAGRTGLAEALGFIRGVSSDLATIWNSVLIPAGTLVIAAFQGIADQINSVFGGDLSGRFIAVAVVLGVVTGAFAALRAVVSPIVGLFAGVLGSLLSFAPLFLVLGLAARAFWTELRTGGAAAINAVRAEAVGFSAALSQLMRGNVAGAWTLFKNAALDAFDVVKKALGEIFGGGATALFATVRQLIVGVTLAAGALAAIFNAIFGTNLNAEGLLLVAVLLQLVGAFGLLRVVGLTLAVILTPIGAAFAAITAAAVILARQFPNLSRSWDQVTQGFSNLLNGDFSKAFEQFGQAFDGVWTNLRQQGALTWAILGAGAIAVSGAVAGLIGQVRALAALLLPLLPVLAALTSFGLLASDVNRGIDPLQKKMEDINQAFRDGKIDLDEYNRRLKELGENASEAASQNATTSRSFADNWKNALEQIKAAMAGTGDAAKKVADEVVPAANQAAGKVRDAFKAAPDFNGFRNVARGVWQRIADDAAVAASGIENAFNGAAGQSFNGFREVSRGVWQKIPEDATKAAADAQQAFRAFDVGDEIARSLSGLQQQFQGAGQGAQEAGNRFDQAMQALQQGGSTGAQALESIRASAFEFGSAFDGIGQSASSNLSNVSSSLDSLAAKLNEATAAALGTAAALAGINTSGGVGFDGGQGFAGGGYTGDGGKCEPAGIVHRGEYVEPAHVVRQPGVLAFLEMLRRVGGDLRKVFSGFGFEPRGFVLGGLVDGFARRFTFDMPGFAEGGLAGLAIAPAGGNLHPVNLYLDGGQKVSGLLASPSVVSQLTRELRLDRLATSGREPRRGK